jgi:hypothetical protein
VAELVDAHDSKSCIFGCVGSIPTFGTRKLKVESLKRKALGFCFMANVSNYGKLIGYINSDYAVAVVTNADVLVCP